MMPMSTRHGTPFCRDVDHGSSTNRKPRKTGRLTSLAFRTKGAAVGFVEKGRVRTAAEKMGVAMRHASKPKLFGSSVWLAEGGGEDGMDSLVLS